MRNPKRIKPTLELIETIWTKYSNLRLMQLLLNCFNGEENIYNIEEDELIKRLERMYDIK